MRQNTSVRLILHIHKSTEIPQILLQKLQMYDIIQKQCRCRVFGWVFMCGVHIFIQVLSSANSTMLSVLFLCPHRLDRYSLVAIIIAQWGIFCQVLAEIFIFLISKSNRTLKNKIIDTIEKKNGQRGFDQCNGQIPHLFIYGTSDTKYIRVTAFCRDHRKYRNFHFSSVWLTSILDDVSFSSLCWAHISLPRQCPQTAIP